MSRASRNKEREQKVFQKKHDYVNLHAENELEGGKFKYETSRNIFRGIELPSTYRITYSGKKEPQEGERIGDTRFGQILYWVNHSVVAKG